MATIAQRHYHQKDWTNHAELPDKNQPLGYVQQVKSVVELFASYIRIFLFSLKDAVNVFIAIAGIFLLGRSIDGPWVNWGQMIKAFSFDVFDKVWNKDYYDCVTTSWEYLTLSMTPNRWNILLFVSIWSRYAIDKWFGDQNASTMTDIALHTAKLARKNDSL